MISSLDNPVLIESRFPLKSFLIYLLILDHSSISWAYSKSLLRHIAGIFDLRIIKHVWLCSQFFFSPSNFSWFLNIFEAASEQLNALTSIKPIFFSPEKKRWKFRLLRVCNQRSIDDLTFHVQVQWYFLSMVWLFFFVSGRNQMRCA